MNLEKIWLVMRQEIYTTMRRAYFVIFAFGLPVIMGVIAIVFYAINSNAPQTPDEEVPPVEEIVQGFVDPSGYIQSIPEGIPLYTFIEYTGEEEAHAALERAFISGYFVIPEDFLETGELTYVVLNFNFAEDRPNTIVFERLLGLSLFGDDLALGAAAMEPMILTTREIVSTSGPIAQDNWLAEQLPFFLVILLYIVILVPAGVLVNSVTDEKKNRVIEILLSSVSASQFFIGKLLALGLLGILQTLFWIGTIWAVGEFGGRPLNLPSDFTIPTQLLVWAVIFAFMGYAMYGTQMAGIGALAPDVKDTRSLTMLILAPLIVGYTFNIIFLEAPDSTIALALALFPLTAPVVMIGRMAVANIPWWQPALSLLLQVVAVIWIVRLFTRLFRAQTLLSGQPLTLKSLITALRTT